MSMSTRARKSAAALALAALLGGASAVAITQGAAPAYAAAPMTESRSGYVDLVARVSPAVVTIEVEKAAEQPQVRFQGPQNFPFEEFMRRFGAPFPNMPQGGDGQGQMMKGLGTGFIVSEDGRIVTNAHVVNGADKVEVKMEDGRSLSAKVLGVDEATDLAVIKVDASGLPTVSFGDSTQLRVGEPVIAMGNPFGLGQTVTTGIVSALGRDINAGPFDHFIQTDAAINRGNSGGPLFNEQGEVVGINTAIFSPSGGSVGVGFAVPSEIASNVVTDLAGDGRVDRGFLGVSIGPVSDQVAAALGLEAPKGAMIQDVTADTPAARAGLKKGDIVLAVDGKAVDTPRDLTRFIAGDAPGAKVSLKLLRAGREKEVSVTLANRADKPA